MVLGRPRGNIKTEDYDSGDDLFIMQNMFKVDTHLADSLWLDVGNGDELLDFSNQKDNSSVLPDQSQEDEFSNNFPDISNICYIFNTQVLCVCHNVFCIEMYDLWFLCWL